MEIRLYFSLMPEALIASQLTPEQFGQYYATGYDYKSKGQAIFFEVDADFRSDFFDLERAFGQCVEHEDGRPKNSVYVSTYRVLEHIPASALRTLYLVTAYGATLAVEPSDEAPPSAGGLHLYKELAPVNSLVASSLNPLEFYRGITTAPSKLVSFPGLCFAELEIGELATNPARGQVVDLPYEQIHHLREAMVTVSQPDKTHKIVERVPNTDFGYRNVKAGSGFFYGNGEELAFYPMPSVTEIREHNPLWWRSANR